MRFLLQCGNSNQSRMKNRCSFLPVLGNIFLFIVFIRGKEEDDYSKVNYFWANEGILSYVKISIRDAISGISGTNKNRNELTMMNETKNIEKHITEMIFFIFGQLLRK